MSKSYTAVVSQAIDLLGEINLEQYQKKLPPHFPSSIGSHMRHIIDHFLALKNGFETGHVDYNVRHRHNEVEQFPKVAIKNFEEIALWLANLQSDWLQQKVTISSEIELGHSNLSECYSTLERELVFVNSHAIHHYALIRTICSMQNKDVPEFFGYAPATIAHINKTA